MNIKSNSLKYKYLIFLIFFSLFISAQKTINTDFQNRIDTSLLNSIFYIPGENVFNPKFYAVNAGLNQFSIDPLLMDYGWSSKLFSSNYSEIEYVKDSIPKLLAKYDYGMDLAHWFTVDFYRPVGKSDLFLKFNRNYSDILYSNTEVESRNFILGSKIYFSDSYSMTLGYFNNHTVKSESAGILSPSDYMNLDEINSDNIVPNLKSAENIVFNNGIVLDQKIKLYSSKDSILKEQLNFGFNIETRIEEDRLSFSMNQIDLDSGYFSNIYLDSTETFDSIGFQKLTIKPSLYWLSGDTLRGLKIGYEKRIYDYEILTRSNIFFNSYLKKEQLNFILSGSYGLESFWRSNYNFSFKFQKTYNNRNDFQIHLDINNETPEFLFIHYSSNHFRWNTEFSSVKKQSVKLKYTFDKFNTSLQGVVEHLTDYIYFDEIINLKQAESNILISKIKLNNVFRFSKFELTSGIVGQISNSDLIRIPNFYTRNSLSFNFFIRKVPFSMGSLFTYFASYKGLSYNPAIRHFNLGDSNIGGFPLLDLFFVVRVGSADLYVKYDNLFFESSNRDMFLGANFPLAKPFLHFGLKWIFKN